MEEEVSESEVLLDSLKFDNKVIKTILNPELIKGSSADDVYNESKIKLKQSILKRQRAEIEENKEKNQLLDDFEMINEKVKEFGMIKIVLEDAVEDLNNIREALPELSKELTIIKNLVREREKL